MRLNKEHQAFGGLVSMFLLYVVWFSTWCFFKFHFFIYDDFDLAIHDQIIWNILHGGIYNSILGTDFLGNHAHFISFLVAPFYCFYPHPEFLLFLQTLFLAAGIFPLYALAQLYLERSTSLVIGAIYLLYPGLGFTNLYEFHPTCFAVFFLLCTTYYFYKEKFSLFNVFMVLSMLCQENIALIFIMWGIYALILQRSLKWVLWPAGLGLLYFLFCVYLILPGFNKNTFNFFHIYAPLGDSLGAVLMTCLQHPLKVMAIIFQAPKINFLVQLFMSVLFIPFLSPLALLPVFLIFLQHLLSFRPGEVSLHYHYTAELVPFIFTAFIFGIKKITAMVSQQKFIGIILLLNALVVNLLIGPHFYLAQALKQKPSDYSVKQKQALINQIPQEASVITTFEFLSHLSHRQELYSFHHVYSGFYTLFTKPYQLPNNVQYALIDFNDYLTFTGFYNPQNYRNIVKFLKDGSWGSMDAQDSTVLFKKGSNNKYPLFDFITDKQIPHYPAHWTVDNRIKLYGYDVKVLSDRIGVKFYWKLLRPEQKDVNIFFDFLDQYGHIITRQYRPLCYRIWPTQAWQKGESIEEYQYISLSPELKGHLKGLMLGVYDYKTGKMIPTDSQDAGGRIALKLTD